MAPLSPAEYSRQRSPKLRKIARPKAIDDQIRFAYYTPSPHAYFPNNPHSPSSKRGGKISTSKFPSALDHVPKMLAHVPGPGCYKVADSRAYSLPDGGRLSPKPRLERLKILDEYPIPAPCDYGAPKNPAHPRQLQGRFSREPKVPKFIQEVEMRSRNVPAPGAHNVSESYEATKPFCPEGGRYLGASKPASYFDAAPMLTEAVPAPGHYQHQGAIQTKATGQPIFRYKSATMLDTLAQVNRIDSPGPGSYSVPSPSPSGRVPALKGRSASNPAMPHPFAYNCAPDYAGKFMNVSPVRRANHADQIFGIGLRKEDLANGHALAVESGSLAHNNGIDAHDWQKMSEDVDDTGSYSDSAVKWKPGGFTSPKYVSPIGASRSEPLEHPYVAEMAKHFPPLTEKHRDAATFLPGAPKKYHSVSAHEAAEEYERLCHGRWQLRSIVDEVNRATKAVLEPLDETKLKQEAVDGMKAQARSLMHCEGVLPHQQEQVLAEMSAVLKELESRGGNGQSRQQ